MLQRCSEETRWWGSGNSVPPAQGGERLRTEKRPLALIRKKVAMIAVTVALAYQNQVSTDPVAEAL